MHIFHDKNWLPTHILKSCDWFIIFNVAMRSKLSWKQEAFQMNKVHDALRNTSLLHKQKVTTIASNCFSTLQKVNKTYHFQETIFSVLMFHWTSPRRFWENVMAIDFWGGVFGACMADVIFWIQSMLFKFSFRPGIWQTPLVSLCNEVSKYNVCVAEILTQ